MTNDKLTMRAFTPADHDAAERIARKLGYRQHAYTDTSALPGLFCLRDRASQRAGCLVMTAELGMIFVQDLEDLNLHDEYEAQIQRFTRRDLHGDGGTR